MAPCGGRANPLSPFNLAYHLDSEPHKEFSMHSRLSHAMMERWRTLNIALPPPPHLVSSCHTITLNAA